MTTKWQQWQQNDKAKSCGELHLVIFENICKYNDLFVLVNLEKVSKEIQSLTTEFLNKKKENNKYKIIDDEYFVDEFVESENPYAFILDWIGCDELKTKPILCYFIADFEAKITKYKKKKNILLQLFKILIFAEIDVNQLSKHGEAPIHWAVSAKYMNEEMIQLLSNAGANMNILNYDGLTPLSFAYEIGNNKSIRALLKNGAS